MARAMTPPTATRKTLREFGFLIGIVFLVVFGWLLPSLKGHSLPLWPFFIGLPALVLGVFAPRALAWPYRGWMALGHGLGWLNGHLILGAVYLLILQPIALVMRVSGHDPLQRRPHRGDSYRELRQQRSINLNKIF